MWRPLVGTVLALLRRSRLHLVGRRCDPRDINGWLFFSKFERLTDFKLYRFAEDRRARLVLREMEEPRNTICRGTDEPVLLAFEIRRNYALQLHFDLLLNLRW